MESDFTSPQADFCNLFLCSSDSLSERPKQKDVGGPVDAAGSDNVCHGDVRDCAASTVGS